MNSFEGRGRSLVLITTLLAISILVEQYLILPWLPWLADLGGIRPMIVFLDIPLGLPITIDLLPVGFVYTIIYSLVVAPGLPNRKLHSGPTLQNRINAVLIGLLAIFSSLLAGGGLFYMLEDHLSREVRNGIDSFGLRADIFLPYPAEGLLHLRGSMIVLIAAYFGVRIFWMQMRIVARPETGIISDSDSLSGQRSVRPVCPSKNLILPEEGRRIVMKLPDPILAEGPKDGCRVYPCIVERDMVRLVDQQILQDRPEELAFANSSG